MGTTHGHTSMARIDDYADPDKAHHPENVAHNTKSLNYVRSTLACISGAIAGILGLTSYTGFAFYFITSLWVGGIVAAYNTGFKPGQYFKQGLLETSTQDLIGNSLSYTLFWTLFFGLVHVYGAGAS